MRMVCKEDPLEKLSSEENHIKPTMAEFKQHYADHPGEVYRGVNPNVMVGADTMSIVDFTIIPIEWAPYLLDEPTPWQT